MKKRMKIEDYWAMSRKLFKKMAVLSNSSTGRLPFSQYCSSDLLITTFPLFTLFRLLFLFWREGVFCEYIEIRYWLCFKKAEIKLIPYIFKLYNLLQMDRSQASNKSKSLKSKYVAKKSEIDESLFGTWVLT